MIKITKQELIFEEIVFQHHPDFKNNSDLRDVARKNPDYFNTERLVEHTMAHVGGYKFVDADGYDFDDWSDSKTASISQYDAQATVGNILGRGKNGSAKLGDLRVVLYNPFYERLDYYFMPKEGWERIREYGEANKGKLRAKYNRDEDVVHKWRDWRVDSFEELAKTPSTVTDPTLWKRSPNNDFLKLFEVSEPFVASAKTTVKKKHRYNPIFSQLFEI